MASRTPGVKDGWRQRADGRYVARIGGKDVYARDVPSLKAALADILEKRGKKDPTTSECIGWSRSVRQGESALRTEAMVVRTLPSRWLDAPMSSITLADVDDWLRGLAEQGYAGTTIQLIKSRMSAAWRATVSRGYAIGDNPFRSARLPVSALPKPRIPIDEPEFAIMLKNLPGDYAWYARVLAATGCRPGEVSKPTCRRPVATLGDVSVVDGVVMLRVPGTKTKAAHRVVPVLESETATWLLDRQKGCPPTEPIISVQAKTVERRWSTVADAVGLEDSQLYDLRRLFAARCRRMGIPEVVRAAWMGHASAGYAAERYDHQLRPLDAAAALVHCPGVRLGQTGKDQAMSVTLGDAEQGFNLPQASTCQVEPASLHDDLGGDD